LSGKTSLKKEISEIFARDMGRPEKAAAIAAWLKAKQGYHWVGLYDVGKDNISAVAWTGIEPPAFPTFPINQGLNGAAVTAKRPVVVQDVRKDPRYLTTFGATRSELIMPVFSGDGAVIGTIDVESDRVGAFAPDDEVFLKEFASEIRDLWKDKNG
jgi:putative methionine-R-sulfoxide reductase with GAF domain